MGRAQSTERWLDESARPPTAPPAERDEADLGPQAAALPADRRVGHPANLARVAGAARVLQRSAGNAGVARLMRTTLARAVTVPVPGWGSNLFGDDDSSVTFDPWASFVLEGKPSLMISGFDPLTNGQGRIAIKAGTKGTLRINCKVHVFLDQKVNEDIHQNCSFSWKVAADLRGALTFEQIGESIGAPDSNEPGFAITSVKGGEGASNVRAQIYMISYQETDVPNVSIGGQAGNNKGQIGGNITLGNETTQPAGTITPGPFVVEVEVTDIPPEPVPEPKVTIESVSVLREYPFLFEKENQHELSGAEEGKFVKWWTTQVDRDLRQDMEDGKVEVELEGTASATGGGQYNRRLAGRRIAAVEEVLRSFGVTRIKPQAQGEYDPETGEETQEAKGLDRGKLEESRREMRKVTMKFWEEFRPPPDTGGGTPPPGGP